MTNAQRMASRPTIAALESMVKARGYRVSVGSWEDDVHVYAFSVETCGPATYGAPKCAACWTANGGGWLSIND